MTDRFVCPPDHKHAENGNCYAIHKCRCESCMRRSARYAMWRRRMIKRGHSLMLDDARGVHRRLQALIALGWSPRQIGEQAGFGRNWVTQVLIRSTTTMKVVQRVQVAYDALRGHRPPQDTGYQKRTVRQMLDLAEANGWVPPVAWDDIDRDEEPWAGLGVAA